MGGRGEVTSTISKLALFLKVSGECYHPQTVTDVTLLSWTDPRPFPMVHLCSDLALVDVLIFPFRAEQREVSFIWAFCFVLSLSPQSHPRAHLQSISKLLAPENPFLSMPRVKRSQCLFQGASLKVLTDGDFSFVIQGLLKQPPDVPGLELFFQPLLITGQLCFVNKPLRKFESFFSGNLRSRKLEMPKLQIIHLTLFPIPMVQGRQ